MLSKIVVLFIFVVSFAAPYIVTIYLSNLIMDKYGWTAGIASIVIGLVSSYFILSYLLLPIAHWIGKTLLGEKRGH